MKRDDQGPVSVEDALHRYNHEPQFYRRVNVVAEVTRLSPRDVLAVLAVDDALDKGLMAYFEIEAQTALIQEAMRAPLGDLGEFALRAVAPPHAEFDP